MVRSLIRTVVARTARSRDAPSSAQTAAFRCIPEELLTRGQRLSVMSFMDTQLRVETLGTTVHGDAGDAARHVADGQALTCRQTNRQPDNQTDKHWHTDSQHTENRGRVLDAKLNITFEALVGLVGEDAVDRLLKVWVSQGMGTGVGQVILRRVQAGRKQPLINHGVASTPKPGNTRPETSPDTSELQASNETRHCIPFHLDYSERTMQVPLNDNYSGGRLVFATDGQLWAPPRTAGCATLHGNDIVHGVSPLTSGVRYSLFLLK